jgi:hypothetical protein
MTELNKKVSRVSRALRFERGKHREVIISLEPPDLLGFRLKGTRTTFYLDAETCYCLAVKAQVAAEAKERRKQKKARAHK